MTRRTPRAGNGAGEDGAEGQEPSEFETTNSDMEGTPTLAEINAFNQRLLDKEAEQEAGKRGKNRARLG